ncbi:aldo/keto reductase [Flammeovirgaceae bacterium SG7u.111]|nr:aldo/keto reductase [Flammeovirgaceae bacterium SG7u.132]WPO34694.1 aldo/keto reductase [Flammeovirgaceae bacterium SG7u.111]
MELRELGTTGLKVTPIGLGLASLGRPGYINLGHSQDLEENYDKQVMEQRAYAVMDEAWKLGIRYFDTARSYGAGEEFLGNWLEARGYKNVAIGSKWGYTYTANWKIEAEAHEVKEHSLPVLQRQWDETKANLASHLDLYQIHSATLESGVLENISVLEQLAKLKNEGVLVGLSVSGPKQPWVIEKALAVKVDGIRIFDAVQATWNILETSPGEMLEQAAKEGLGVIIKEGVANGRLTGRNGDEEFKPKMAILTSLAEKYNVSVDSVVLAAIIAQPWVSTVLSGAATVAHLTSNVAALAIGLKEEDLVSLVSLKEEPEVYWAKRSTLRWN